VKDDVVRRLLISGNNRRGAAQHSFSDVARDMAKSYFPSGVLDHEENVVPHVSGARITSGDFMKTTLHAVHFMRAL
jgi:hypothetical protein